GGGGSSLVLDLISNVVRWLDSNSIQQYRVDGAFIDFRCDIATANTLFNASYYYYTNLGAVKLRTSSYSIPDEIQDDVTLLDPGTYFGSAEPLTPSLSTPTPARQADVGPRPHPLANHHMYNTTGYVPTADSRSHIGFGSFLNQTVRFDGLLQFEEHNGIPAQNISVTTFVGAENNQSSTQYTEANLDAQVIVGLAHPLAVMEYITGGSPPFKENLHHPTDKQNYNEPWVPYYRILLATPVRDIPQILSHSYGEPEDSVPRSYAALTCNIIGIMGLRGITIIQASGDSGVGAGCLATDFKTIQFNAIFPATCPWVTSVGATTGLSPERAWNASSGGFSNYFSRPAYQDSAIAAYMNNNVAPETHSYYGHYTNWGGRGFPDVAAHSMDPDFEVVYAGQLAASGGTSASAPVWAAIVGLLNDARLAAGKPVLSWLNPLIYRYGTAVLNGITEGHSVGCNGAHPGSGVAEPNAGICMHWHMQFAC
ncbi:tripeptidyl peptidase a protein, partial [Apiospora saccharicola]